VFDIGFSELLVIGLVALIVIGPERLPRVARTVGHLAGRLQRYVNDVKADINREMELDELRKMRDEMQQAATEMESSVRKELGETEQALNQAVTEAAAPAPAPAPDPAPHKELPEKSATPEARG
jgi:sec-independent protein translocase protein TatB